MCDGQPRTPGSRIPRRVQHTCCAPSPGMSPYDQRAASSHIPRRQARTPARKVCPRPRSVGSRIPRRTPNTVCGPSPGLSPYDRRAAGSRIPRCGCQVQARTPSRPIRAPRPCSADSRIPQQARNDNCETLPYIQMQFAAGSGCEDQNVTPARATCAPRPSSARSQIPRRVGNVCGPSPGLSPYDRRAVGSRIPRYGQRSLMNRTRTLHRSPVHGPDPCDDPCPESNILNLSAPADLYAEEPTQYLSFDREDDCDDDDTFHTAPYHSGFNLSLQGTPEMCSPSRSPPGSPQAHSTPRAARPRRRLEAPRVNLAQNLVFRDQLPAWAQRDASRCIEVHDEESLSPLPDGLPGWAQRQEGVCINVNDQSSLEPDCDIPDYEDYGISPQGRSPVSPDCLPGWAR